MNKILIQTIVHLLTLTSLIQSECLSLTLVKTQDSEAAETISIPTKLLAPKINAQSAILVDAETGQVIWSRNEHVRRPNASTTKVMTVLLALEHGKLDEVVTAPKHVKDFPESSLHLVPGEKIRLSDLIYAACIRSANDAAYAIGTYIGRGNVSTFVKMMNDRAKQLGMVDTQFRNTNGLNEQGHYSSAYDLACLAREATKNPDYNRFVNTREITLERKASPDRLLRTKSSFLKFYPGADGIKSGYTRQAGHCFIGSATRNGWRLISVVLKSNSAGDDTKALMDYAFTNFEKLTVAKAGTRFSNVHIPQGRPEYLPVILGSNLSVIIQKGRQPGQPRSEVGYISVPLSKGDTVGYAVISSNEKILVRAPLLAGEDVSKAPNLAVGFLIGAAVLPVGFYGYRCVKCRSSRIDQHLYPPEDLDSIELDLPEHSKHHFGKHRDSSLSNPS